MTEPVDFPTTIEPVAPAPQPTPAETAPRRAEAATAEPHRPEPISLEVMRGADGVFVYTLSDPATGRLISVIPDKRAERTADPYASGDWVSLTA